MDTKLPWSLGKVSYKSSLWSRARQRNTLSPTCFSAIRHGQRQKDSTSSNKKQCNWSNSYFKIWSVLAAGLCCIMANALMANALIFCSCHLLGIQTKYLLLTFLSTPTGDPDHQTSQDLMCPFSLLHVSDGPGSMGTLPGTCSESSPHPPQRISWGPGTHLAFDRGASALVCSI